MRAVAQRIKQEREKQGKSTIEMAHILSVPEQEIIRIENGELQAHNARYRRFRTCP